MPWTDKPLEALWNEIPEREEQPDFDAFWAETMEEAARHPLEPRFEPIATQLELIETYDVTFRGFGGHPIKGWLQVPRTRAEVLPGVVQYLGYSTGRGDPHQFTAWAAAGFVHLIMDNRGQGGVVFPGATHDPVGTGPAAAGWMTASLDDPRNYFFRRIYVDAARALEVLRTHPRVDANCVAAVGGSQGGALTLAAVALGKGAAAASIELPYMCHIRRATRVASRGPYLELVQFLRTFDEQRETSFRTLSYFDAANLGARARVPARFTAGLMDEVCPPSTCFCAFHHYGGPKTMQVYEYLEHDDRWGMQLTERLRYIRAQLGLTAGSAL